MRTLKRFGKAFGLALSLAALGLAGCGGSSGDDDGDDVGGKVEMCTEGMHDGGDWTCVPVGKCSPGYLLRSSGECFENCGYSDTEHDGGDSRCVPKGTCSPGYHDGGDGKCLAAGQCIKGRHDGGDGTCVYADECSAGFHMGGGWVCLPEGRCAEGYHDGGDGRCMALDRCATGYHMWKGGVCGADKTCPQGKHDFGGGTCIGVSGCDPVDYHDDGMGYCVAKGYCAPGFVTGSSGSCVIHDMEWIDIPEGTFVPYGDASYRQEGYSYEPRSIPAFKLNRTPVTVSQYMECVNDGACSDEHFGKNYKESLVNKGVHPVRYVDWDDAERFCKWAGGRLPSADEWEYASTHDGQKQRDTAFPWGDAYPIHCLTANYRGNTWNDSSIRSCDGTKEVESGSATTSAVGTYSPDGDSPLGLVDMIGNLSEWTSTEAGTDKYIAKGGSWYSTVRVVYDDKGQAFDKTGADCSLGRLGIRCAK